MRLTRLLPAVPLVVLVLALAGCSGDDEPAADPSDSSDSGAPSESAPDSGDGQTDAEPDPAPAEAVDVCTVLSADDIGVILEGTVTVSEVPGGGCSFDQDDPRAASVSIATIPMVDGNGGFEGARSSIEAISDGDVEELAGVGDQAIIAVGPTFGGENDQGHGLVLAGGTLVQVGLVQGVGLEADVVRQMTVDILTLAAERS